MVNIQAVEINTQVNGTRLSGFFARPERPGPGVLVLHAWWGLNPFFKGLCQRLGEQGFLAFAPDLVGGQVATTVAEAQKLADGRDEMATVKPAALAAVAWLRQQVAAQGDASLVKRGLSAVGFSMGGTWAILLSKLAAQDVSAVVLFYEAYSVDFTGMRARFQGHYGDLDERVERKWIDSLEADLQAAGRPVEFYHYPQAGHWFFESDRHDAYRPDDAALAWQRMLEFLKA